MKKVKYAIIGAGTAGLTAKREISRETDDYILINSGPLGTTCARVGCMPSKVFIQVANDFHRRKVFEQIGIDGADALKVDTQKVMKHTRKLRDSFTNPIINSMEKMGDQLIQKKARFIDDHTLDLGDDKIRAEKIIIATGSTPVVPKEWKEKFGEQIVTTDELFELKELPQKIAVVGLGVIGLEMGQALARLGLDVIGFSANPTLGGAQDKDIQKHIQKELSKEMTIVSARAKPVRRDSDGRIVVESEGQEYAVDLVLSSMGRRPNLESLGLKEIGIEHDEKDLPLFDHQSLQIKGHPHLLLAGDVNQMRPILHEASDQGFIAAQVAMDPTKCFQMRTPLAMTFSSPQIAQAGQTSSELKNKGIEFIEGEVSFKDQGRAKAMVKNSGLLKVYVHAKTGELLGTEMACPSAEHLSHLLSWAIQQKLDVFTLLKMPFYHPVLEEGLRTALRNASKKVPSPHRPMDLSECPDPSAGS